MTQDMNPERSHGRETAGIINLHDAGTELLQSAHASSSGRSGRTLVPGAGAPLQPTLFALVSGRSLAEHETPTAASLQVLSGAVRLTGGDAPVELRSGEFTQIPPVRHGLDALDDAVVLITVTP